MDMYIVHTHVSEVRMINLLSAVAYMDIIFFVVLGLGIVGGLLGGLARAMKGLFAAVFIILASLMLVGATLAPICHTSGVQKMTASIESKTDGWGEVFTTPVYIDEDGVRYVIVEIDGATKKVPIEDAGGSGIVNKSKAKLAKRLAKRFVTEETQGASLGRIAADMITSIIMSVIAFVGYCVALGIIFFILRRIFRHIHKGDGAAAAIERVLGGLVGGFMAFTFLLLILAILRACDIGSLNRAMSASPAVGYLNLHNPLSAILSRIFG